MPLLVWPLSVLAMLAVEVEQHVHEGPSAESRGFELVGFLDPVPAVCSLRLLRPVHLILESRLILPSRLILLIAARSQHHFLCRRHCHSGHRHRLQQTGQLPMLSRSDGMP